MSDQTLQTEFEFTLPRGYVDDEGTLHKEGRMRLATAADEIQPLQDPQVQSNQSYLTISLLGRVVTDLGTLEDVDAGVIENLFVSDLEYLQAMYERVNNAGRNTVATACPDCGHDFEVEVETGRPVLPGDGDLEPPASGDGADTGAEELTPDGDEEAGEMTAGNPAE